MKILLWISLISLVQANVIDWSNMRQLNMKPNAERSSGRIVGGTVAPRGFIPYQAAVISDSRVFCAGALVSETIILTAAHCINNKQSYEVHLGADYFQDYEEQGRVIVLSRESALHPDFNISANFLHDIGFVRLPQPVEFSQYIGVVNLPSRSQLEETFANKIARTSGWGTVSNVSPSFSEQLRYVDVEVTTEDRCQASYGDQVITECQVCASTNYGTEGVCSGDAGAPLTYIDDVTGEQTLIGLANWGNPFGCQKPDPNVYIRVSCYVDWIEDEAGIIIRP